MKVLIIGLGELGQRVLEDFSVDVSSYIEIYTRDHSKYAKLLKENVISLSNLSDSKQPDIIFITANLYKPEDRFKYLQDNLNTDKYLNVRDDEKNKNEEMIRGIIKNIKHLNSVPIITTANPSELLVKIIHDELGWNSVFNMQMMLDNKRIGNIVNLSENDYLCIGEHGNPIPTISHIKKFDINIYNQINIELSNVISKIHYEYKGTPPLYEAKKSLDILIESILLNKELNCILTTFDNNTNTGFGKPFIVKGLNFKEQKIPILSDFENTLLNETKERLIKKWGNK